MRRQFIRSKQEARSSRHACTGQNSACADNDSNSMHKRHAAITTSNSCFVQLCRRRADCHVTLVSQQMCQPGRRRRAASSMIDKLHVSSSKRRINDVMSQCIQAYCTDVLHHVRIACILHHCNRSRRAQVNWQSLSRPSDSHISVL